MKLRTFMSYEALNLKVLIVGMSANGKHAELQRNFKNATFCTWHELNIEDGVVKVKDVPITKFQFFLLGTVGENIDMYTCIEAVAKKNGINYFSYGQPSHVCNKMLQSVNMAAGGVDQIKTIIALGKEVKAGTLIRELKLPIVSKITKGSKGKGVEKHDTKESLESLLKKNPDQPYIFQEFIPNDGDFRIFYVRDQLIYAVNRTNKGSEFRHNVNGKDTFVDQLDDRAKDLADRAMLCMKYDVTGVDVVQHNVTKKWYVLEINPAPQFEGDPSIAIDAIVRYIK